MCGGGGGGGDSVCVCGGGGRGETVTVGDLLYLCYVFRALITSLVWCVDSARVLWASFCFRLLNCLHENIFCVKIGSTVSHFNVL